MSFLDSDSWILTVDIYTISIFIYRVGLLILAPSIREEFTIIMEITVLNFEKKNTAFALKYLSYHGHFILWITINNDTLKVLATTLFLQFKEFLQKWPLIKIQSKRLSTSSIIFLGLLPKNIQTEHLQTTKSRAKDWFFEKQKCTAQFLKIEKTVKIIKICQNQQKWKTLQNRQNYQTCWFLNMAFFLNVMHVMLR